MPKDRRQAAERVDATAHRARQVVREKSRADGTQQPSSGARAPGGHDLEPSEAGLVPTEGGWYGFRWITGKSRDQAEPHTCLWRPGTDSRCG
jgi:hypothetical protein